jgi:predicted metalloprotease with PDZ domain
MISQALMVRSQQILVYTLLVVGCAPSTPVDGWAVSTGAPIHYRLTLAQLGLASAVDVVVTVRSPDGLSLPDPLELSIPHRWAGEEDLSMDILDLRAERLDGVALELRRDLDAASVRTQGNSALRIRYEVRPRYREHNRASRFHAVGTPEYLFAYGRNLFVWPTAFSAATPVGIEMRAEQQAAFWVTTLGTADRGAATVTLTIEDLLDGAYVAGRTRVVESRWGSYLAVAIDPALGPIEDDALRIIGQLVEYAEAKYGPPPIASAVAIVLRRSDDSHIMVGSGRPGGFVLEFGDGVGPGSRGFAELVAHENMHRYLGNWVRFERGTELSTLWFKEGLVDYLASTAVMNAEIGDRATFLETLTAAAVAYSRNEWAGRTFADQDAIYWSDDHLRRLPYDQGFLMAFWLDAELAENDDGLEPAIAALVAEWAGREFPRLNNAAIQDFFEARLGCDLNDFFERWVERGERLPVAEWLARVGIEL